MWEAEEARSKEAPSVTLLLVTQGSHRAGQTAYHALWPRFNHSDHVIMLLGSPSDQPAHGIDQSMHCGPAHFDAASLITLDTISWHPVWFHATDLTLEA